MIETVHATECSYDGLVIDRELVHLLDTLNVMFDMDMGDLFSEQYENPRVLHATWGFEGEVGELKDAFKKSLFYRKDLDVVNIAEEIGDCIYFVTILEEVKGTIFYGTRDILDKLAKKYDYTLEKCCSLVENKLRIRYPDGFSTTKASERDLDAERKVLEGED